jgi:hypothetical protein
MFLEFCAYPFITKAKNSKTINFFMFMLKSSILLEAEVNGSTKSLWQATTSINFLKILFKASIWKQQQTLINSHRQQCL